MLEELFDLQEEVWRRAIVPGGNPQSIVAATEFHNRVRDGVEVEPLH